MAKLGVNIDHVATLRQQRREFDPDPVAAARICEKSGADSIVCHLREDRRHIQDRDVRNLRDQLRTRLNLEMSLSLRIQRIALQIKPDIVTLVPEKREELTTEGGLNVKKQFTLIRSAVDRFLGKDIEVSLFVDPVKLQIDQARETGARVIELHTGSYANASNARLKTAQLAQLVRMAKYAQEIGLLVAAGHGLKYHDTRPVAKIRGMNELNIGHSIICRAMFVGLSQAVKEMKALVTP